jgi:hypothetical protein
MSGTLQFTAYTPQGMVTRTIVPQGGIEITEDHENIYINGSGAGLALTGSPTNGDTVQYSDGVWAPVNPIVLTQGPQVDNKIVVESGGNLTEAYGWVSANSQTYSAGTNTIQNSDPTFIYADSSTGTNTLNLPQASTVLGKVYCIIPVNFNHPIVVAAYALDNILQYGSSSQVISLTLDPASCNAYPVIITSDGVGQWIQMTPIADILVYQKSSDFTALGNSTNYVDTTSAGVTATLPDATEIPGQSIKIIFKAGSNTVTIATTSSQTINTSSPSQTLSSVGASYTFESDGANYWITASTS